MINGAGNEVTGKAEPDSTVNILDPRGNIIGTTTATADGDFTAALVPPQTNGEILTANATDAAGNKGAMPPSPRRIPRHRMHRQMLSSLEMEGR